MGGTGSIGSKITEQLLSFGLDRLTIFSRDESKYQYLYDRLGRPSELKYILGDIRDRERLRAIINETDIIINVAALKSVPYCEENPIEAIKTNIIGTQNIIDVALEKNIENVITISTDKAADPSNTYGATKFLSEKLFISAEKYKGAKRTTFTCVRLGNVLGSGNSILPVIRNQIVNGQPITLITSDMTRFVMTTNEVVQLLFKSLELSQGGEIFMSKMNALHIWDLVDVFVENYCKKHNISEKDIKKRKLFARKGEKEYEKLFSDFEVDFAYTMGDVLVILPEGKLNTNLRLSKLTKINDFQEYNSSTARKMTKAEIQKVLIKENLIC